VSSARPLNSVLRAGLGLWYFRLVNPVVYILLAAVPLAVLGNWLRIYPDRRLAYVCVVPAVASVLLVFSPPALLWPILGIDLLVVVAAAADLATTPRAGDFYCERQAGRIASLAKPHPVALTVANGSSLPRLVIVRDDASPLLNPEPAEFELHLAPRSRVTVHYELRAKRRGAFSLERVYLRARSRLGLWQRLFEYPVPGTIHVYPDMKQLAEYAVLARTNRLSLVGVRRTRRIGQDNEFERLRDYTLDDNFKHIDWRSTARRGKLTVKDFQTSQSQRIIFLVDCGRMMTNEASGVSLLDHALNAMLMLGYVALRQRDSVGMLAFSDRVHGYVPPRGGRNQMNHLLHASFDRFPKLVESRYDEALLYLAAHCRKRALVVLITNLIDEVNARQVHLYLSNLAGRHLPLGVLLRDRRLFEAVDQAGPEPTGKALYRAAAAADILTWRREVLTDLESRGVLALDVFPEDMTAALVNRYLEIKARHLL
jgi:uncharacterized protein (DUF58 family)